MDLPKNWETEGIDGSQWRLVVDAIEIDMGDHFKTATRGETLEWAPTGALASLIQADRVLPADADDPLMAMAVESTPEQETPAEAAGLSVSELDIPPATQKSLQAAGLETVDAIVDFAVENAGLQSIDGIGPKAEQEIRKAIDKLSS